MTSRRPWAFITDPQPADLKKGLQTIRDNLSAEEIHRILAETNELKATEPERTTWYRRLDNQRTMRKVLEWTERRADCVGYSLGVLWSRREARPAYEALVDAIQVTGSFEDYKRAFGLKCGDNPELILAAWTLARQVSADCWSLYGWDHRRNRPVLISHANLFYPEAVEGTCWIDGLVRRSLLEENPREPVEVVTDGEGNEGCFRLREGVRRAWKVFLRAPRTRALLLLNWRDGSGPPPEPASSAYPGFTEPSERALPRPPRFPTPRALAEPRDLFLAVRYVNGWLAQRDVAVAGPARSRNHVPVDVVIRLIATSFESWLSGARFGDDPELSLESLSHLKLAFHSILETQRPAIPVMTACDRDGRRLVLPRHFVKQFVKRDGTPLTSLEIDLTRFENGTLPEGSSLLAQSIAWRTSLLVRRLGPQKKPRSRMSTSRRSLLDVRIWPKEARRRTSEVIVPVIVDDTPIGAFSVEHSGAESVTVDQLGWIEIVAFVVGGLFAISRDEGAQIEKEILAELLLRDDHWRDGETLLFRFCEWISSLTKADLVHVLTYDDERSLFQPRGVFPSELLRHRLQDRYGITGTGDARLIGRALESSLAPRRRGRSWDVFRDNHPHRIDDVAGERRKKTYFTDFVSNTFEAIYGFPFKCHRNVAADGVIWIAFAKGNEPNRVGQNRIDARTEEAIQRVGHVVAGVYAAYRYDVQEPAASPA